MHHFTKCITTFRYLLFADMRTNFAYYYRNFLMSSCFQFVLNVKIFGTYSIILGPNHTMLLWVLRVLLNLIFESSIDHPLGKLKFQILICSRFTRHSVALCLPNHDQYYGLWACLKFENSVILWGINWNEWSFFKPIWVISLYLFHQKYNENWKKFTRKVHLQSFFLDWNKCKRTIYFAKKIEFISRNICEAERYKYQISYQHTLGCHI